MTASKILLVCFLLCLLFARPERAAAEPEKHGFLHRVHHNPDGTTAKYVLFVPHSYEAERDYPIILFLHGHGESGSDGHKQAEVGLGPAVKKRANQFPFLAVFPQSQKYTWQAGSEDAQRALAILDEVQKKYRTDLQRVYLTGLSMGGFGTWSLAAKYPERWAAIVPVCGGGNPQKASAIKNIPCWCFHGDADKAVPIAKSREMVAALKAAGGHPLFTEYPGVGHNSWDRAYATAELYPWLLEHRTK